MIYLEKIEIINKTYPGSKVLDNNFTIECSDVNLFVGNQGCGKSTILNLIRLNHKDIKFTVSDYTKNNDIQTFFFDSEKDNPRIKDIESYTNPNGTDRGIGVGSALSSRYKSHGEILEKFIINPLLKVKDSVVILDEPESGLSITNQFKLIDTINVAVLNNCQLFIATHCYPLIQSFNVISLEHNDIMRGLEFIEKIKNNI